MCDKLDFGNKLLQRSPRCFRTLWPRPTLSPFTVISILTPTSEVKLIVIHCDGNNSNSNSKAFISIIPLHFELSKKREK